MKQTEIAELISWWSESYGLTLDELWDCYLRAREERRQQTGSLQPLLRTDFELYEKLMSERDDYALEKVREHMREHSEKYRGVGGTHE